MLSNPFHLLQLFNYQNYLLKKNTSWECWELNSSATLIQIKQKETYVFQCTVEQYKCFNGEYKEDTYSGLVWPLWYVLTIQLSLQPPLPLSFSPTTPLFFLIPSFCLFISSPPTTSPLYFPTYISPLPYFCSFSPSASLSLHLSQLFSPCVPLLPWFCWTKTWVREGQTYW